MDLGRRSDARVANDFAESGRRRRAFVPSAVHDEWLRDRRDMAAGRKPGSYPADRPAVNVGTIPPSASLGKAQRPPVTAGRGGGALAYSDAFADYAGPS
jgi:hypothetical protein